MKNIPYVIVDPRRITLINPEDKKIDEYNVTSIFTDVKNQYITYKIKTDANKEINLISIDRSLNEKNAA